MCMLVVVAECRVLPDNWQDFEEEMTRITELVRAEPGCLRYDTTTSTEEPGLFIILEEWESKSHLDEHLATEHMKKHSEITAEWSTGPVHLSLYEVETVERVEL